MSRLKSLILTSFPWWLCFRPWIKWGTEADHLEEIENVKVELESVSDMFESMIQAAKSDKSEKKLSATFVTTFSFTWTCALMFELDLCWIPYRDMQKRLAILLADDPNWVSER